MAWRCISYPTNRGRGFHSSYVMRRPLGTNCLVKDINGGAHLTHVNIAIILIMLIIMKDYLCPWLRPHDIRCYVAKEPLTEKKVAYVLIHCLLHYNSSTDEEILLKF